MISNKKANIILPFAFLEVENMNNIVQMRMFAFCGLLSILNYIWCTDLKDI